MTLLILLILGCVMGKPRLCSEGRWRPSDRGSVESRVVDLHKVVNVIHATGFPRNSGLVKALPMS
jgi:hypothetical protein